MTTYLAGYKSVAFGTEITHICAPRANKIARIRSFGYTAAGTEHNAYIMKCLGFTTVAAFVASGSTTMTLAAIDPGRDSTNTDEDLAANDFVAYMTKQGVVEMRKISSVSGATITLASAVGADVPIGNKVWAFYQLARSVHKQFRIPATTYREFKDIDVMAGIPVQDGVGFSVSGVNVPLAIAVDNVSATGKLEYVAFDYVDQSEESLS